MDFIDVFGFAGGFDLGMVQAGHRMVGKKENPKGFGVANLLANRHLVGTSWQPENGPAYDWEPIDAPLIVGNPPCSGFSPMSSQKFRGINSPANVCMHEFTDYAVRCVKAFPSSGPQAIAFESVQQAHTTGLPLMRQLHAKLRHETGIPWQLTHVLHNALGVGGAALRKRYFWVLMRRPFGVDEEELYRLPVLDDIIGDIADAEIQWERQPYTRAGSWWTEQENMRNYGVTAGIDGMATKDTPGHRRSLSILEREPWQQGEDLQRVVQRYYNRTGSLPPEWDAIKVKGIDTDEIYLGINQPFRWRAQQVARVVTGGVLHSAVHPYKDRFFTHREAARIMGFPDSWLIEPIRHVSGLEATWGKGITVQCGRWIGKWLGLSVSGSPGTIQGELVGEDERVIQLTNSWKSVL